jgi:sugar fermentation stimulation protein A
LEELLTAGREIWLAPIENHNRKTNYDLKLVEYAGVFVSVDARLPNRLFEESVLDGRLTGWDFPGIEREVTMDDSRLDFRLAGGGKVCWVETKSVTLVQDGVALFPDVPTLRGQRHVRTLSNIVQTGQRAGIVFIIQRPDALRFSPHATVDPVFARAIGAAMHIGVDVKAYTCRVSKEGITIDGEIPVKMNAISD